MKIVPFNPYIDSLVFALNMKDTDLERIAIEHLSGGADIAVMHGVYKGQTERSYQVPLSAIPDITILKNFLIDTGQEVIWKISDNKVFECKQMHNYYVDALSKPLGTLFIMHALAACDYTRCTESNEYWVLV